MNIRNKEAVKALFSSVDGIGPVNPGEPSEKGKNDLRHGPDYKNKQDSNGNKDFNKLLEDEMEKQKKGTVSQGLVKSSYYEDLEDVFIVYPWDKDQVTGVSDEDLGLSYAVQAYGDEFVQLDDNTLEDMKDMLVQYFDDEAFVRDWNINNPNDEDQIESIYDIESPEDLSVDELATYFDYEAYGRDLRLNERMAWNKKYEYWFSDLNLDDEDIEDEDDVIRWS